MAEGVPFVIWDSGELPDESVGITYTWTGYQEKGGVFSLLRYVETHGNRIRQKYMGFISGLGDVPFGDRSLSEQLEFGGGFNLWWMSLVTEMSPYKSPRILDCLRIIALEEILISSKPSSVRLVNTDKDIGDAIKTLCGRLGLAFEWDLKATPERPRFTASALYQKFPHVFRALVYFVYYLGSRWRFRRCKMSVRSTGGEMVLFLSYFYNLDASSSALGRFSSNQWGSIPEFLFEQGIGRNFIHHFVASPNIPDPKTALGLVRKFNNETDVNGIHTFLDAFLGLGVVASVIGTWLKMVLKVGSVRRPAGMFELPNSQVSLWPLLRGDWNASLFGSTSIINVLWAKLFDRALAGLPHQKLGLYLCENQGWERAFISAWRKHRHGRLIAVQHSTVRFWDIRYYNDAAASTRPNSMPIPDRIAVNGPLAWDSYTKADYPVDRLVEVEALRYQHLNGFPGKKDRTGNGDGRSFSVKQPKKVLILGDFERGQTIKMLEHLASAVRLGSLDVSFTLKCHPVCYVAPAEFPSLRFDVNNGSIADIAGDFDIAFCSNSSSAVLDASASGLPVLIFIDSAELNHSPLRGQPGAFFVATDAELAAALQAPIDRAAGRSIGDFFWVDDKMPKWSKVIALAIMDNP